VGVWAWWGEGVVVLRCEGVVALWRWEMLYS